MLVCVKDDGFGNIIFPNLGSGTAVSIHKNHILSLLIRINYRQDFKQITQIINYKQL